MTKLKQLNNKFDAFYSRENKAWIGEVHCLTISRVLCPVILDKSKFYSVRKGNAEMGMID